MPHNMIQATLVVQFANGLVVLAISIATLCQKVRAFIRNDK